MSFLDIDQVSFTFPGWPPVGRSVDWRIAQGEFHCLVGRSGCGKTTLLKLAAPTLLEWHRVIDNVLLPVSLQHKPSADEIDKAQQLLALLGLAGHAQHYPRQLSGGQQSRVALARALILEPSLLLLDEPFAALDAITRGELQDDLLQMCRLRRTTVLFVTHDIAEAVYLGDQVAVMNRGRIVSAIRVEVGRPRAPAMRYGEAFNLHCAQVRDAMDLEAA